MGLYEYGTEVTLTAIPAPGYRLKRWASDTGALMNNGYRYESTITVKATAGYIYTAEFEPTTIPPPPLPTFTGKVTVTGGTADIFTASDDSSVEPASYYHDSCGVYWTFLARCDIDPGYDFVYWRCDPPRNDIPEYYVYNEPQLNMELNAFGSAGDTVTFEAHLTKTVNLDIEIQGQGVVTSPDFRAYWNPQLYFTGKYIDGNPPPPRTDSNRVQMTADPCPGWGFHHWEIKDAGGQWQTVTWYNPLKKIYEPDTRPISVFMNWWKPVPDGGPTDPENLRHVPPGEETHYVRAVFSNSKKALVVEGGQKGYWDTPWRPTDADFALFHQGYSVTKMDKPLYQDVYNAIPDYSVFAFNGHGGPDQIEIYREHGTSTSNVIKVSHLTMPYFIPNQSFSYKFVYLNCCEAGQSADRWIAGFKAQAFVGWETKINNRKALYFDREFWTKIINGYTTASAAYWAYLDIQTLYWFLPSDIIACRGSVRFDMCTD
jgi:hypothetical protein